VPARLSHDAGSYLCNYAYWLGLEAAARHGSIVAFVHVPRMGRAGKRALTLTDLTRAGEAILLALVAAARANRHSGASGNSREGRRRREPGIHTPCAGVMDSGLAASRRPGMTEGHR
jgi:hypothetical protein